MSSNSERCLTRLTGYILNRKRRRYFKMRYLLIIPIFCAVKEAFGSENSVVELTSENFDDSMRQFKTALVMFHAPWCGHCKYLKPEFENAAKRLKEKESSVHLVSVDCAGEGKDVCHELNIRGYPTLKIFREGIFTKEYKGSRKVSAIVDYMLTEAGPPAMEITSEIELYEFLDESRVIVVGFFDSDSDLKSTYLNVAESMKDSIKFGVTSMKMGKGIQLYQPKYLQNKFEPPIRTYDGKVCAKEIHKWILKNKNGLVGYRRASNHDEFKDPLVIVYYNIDFRRNPKGTGYWRNRALKVAKDFEKEFNFAFSSRAEYRQELAQFGFTHFYSEKPVVTAKINGNKYSMKKEFHMDAFREFLVSLKDGTAEPFVKSEDIPNQEGHVIKVVGKTFNELITNSKNDTFVAFSAPWCDHCRTLAPTWEDLGTTMQNEEVDIVVFNAAENDFPPYFEFDGYPSIFWLAKGKKTEPEKYNGPRTLPVFVKFIATSVKGDLKGFNRDGSPKVQAETATHSAEEL